MSLGRRWYLVAWDVERHDWRTFRVDRTSKPRLAGVRTKPRELPAEDAAAFVAQSISASETRVEASVLLHLPLDDARAKVPERVGTLSPAGARTTRLVVEVDSLDWLAMRVATLGVDFTVERPDEFRELIGRLAERLRRSV